jgi:2-phospho-L-lactate guanylyltransferase
MANSNPLAILPVKSFDEAKQRLGEVLDRPTRRVLAEAMFTDVLIALRRSALVDGVLVVTGDHGAQRIAAGYGAMVLEDDELGHNRAANNGVGRALELGAERVVLVPGDCPLLDPAELDDLIGRAPQRRLAVIVPDRHGSGTNALLLSPPDAMAPAFGPGSRERHERLARAASLEAQTIPVGSLGLDVDTPEDLAAVEAALAARHGGAAHTRGMLRQLARIGS